MGAFPHLRSWAYFKNCCCAGWTAASWCVWDTCLLVMPGAGSLRVVCRSQWCQAAVPWCRSHHLCSVVALQPRWLVLPFLLQRMEMCGDPETPALLQGRVCVSLHHCLAADEEGAWVPLLLLPWLSWEWISVSFSVCLLVKEVGTFPFLSTSACPLLTLVWVGYFFLVPVGCLGCGWVHLWNWVSEQRQGGGK